MQVSRRRRHKINYILFPLKYRTVADFHVLSVKGQEEAFA